VASLPNNNPQFHRERPLGEVLNDLKVELKDFISTRIQMLKSEMNEKAGILRASAPAIVIGAVIALTAWILFSLALVFLISMAFQDKPYQYAISFGIVAIVYGIIGGAAIGFGYSNIKSRSMTPERTLRVLKQDQIWMQTEAKTEL
jgi:Putative Actinobacterial Holin-X, holin superfamily III